MRARVRPAAVHHYPPLRCHPLRTQARLARIAHRLRTREGDPSWNPSLARCCTGPQSAGARRDSPRHGICGSETPKGLADCALLLLGCSGALRRSELVALNANDLEETDDGLRVTIRQSKTDQEGKGQVIAVIRGGACCPVKAVKAWLAA